MYLGKILLLLSFVCCGNKLFAQRELYGYVYDSKDSIALSAVVVTQATNKVLTDENGFFIISLSSNTDSLIFNFIGFKVKKILPTTDTMHVYLQEDVQELVPISLIEVFYYNSINVGYSGGLRFTPFGAVLQGNITYVLGIPLFTDFDLRYQTNLKSSQNLSWSVIKRISSTQENYLDNSGYRLDLIAYGRKADFYRKENDSLTIDEIGLKGYFTKRSYILVAGMGHQKLDNSEGKSKNVGIILGAGYSFPFGLYVLITETYWQKYWQFDFTIRQKIGQSKFTILAGVEKLTSYKEIKAGLIYSFRLP